MPRAARKHSRSGIYHVMLRGINRQTIFERDEDYQYFIYVLKSCQKVSRFILYAYCLMGNHVHLLIREGNGEDAEPLEIVFKRIGVKYSIYYNRTYARIGHLFQDRYKSEPCEDMRYFMTLLAYIHRNPVEAGICKELWEYPWSSWDEYMGRESLCAVRFVLSRINSDVEKAREYLRDLCSRPVAEKCLDIGGHRLSDDEVRDALTALCNAPYTKMLSSLVGERREDVIQKLICCGAGVRQISRITGWPYEVIRMTAKEMPGNQGNGFCD